MPNGMRLAEVDDLAGEDHVLDLEHGSVVGGPSGDLPAKRAISADHDVDRVRHAVRVWVVVGALDVAAEVRVAALDVGDAKPLDHQQPGGIGRRGQPAPAGSLEGGDGAVGGGEPGLVGAGGVGRPSAPVAAARGDPVGLDGGAGKIIGAGVGDLGVVAVVELPAAPVGRAAGAAGGGRV